MWMNLKLLNNMKRNLLGAMAIASIIIFSDASAEKMPDAYQAGSQYYAYPVPEYGIPVLTDAPEGYQPFHMEHYGRHGSRWRMSMKDYEEAVEILEKAQRNGKLTPRGEEVLEEIRVIAHDAQGRLGELTPLGHRQHRGIASRMVKNFPELFTDTTYLDAKSTMVIRCILSMANEAAEFQKLFPGMPITMDASQTTQTLLNHNDVDTIIWRLTNEAKPTLEAFTATLPKPDKFYDKVFTDRQFVADSLGNEKAFNAIFDMAVNIQSHDDYASLNDLFTPEEMDNAWKASNAYWYTRAGNTPLTKNRWPYSQRYLLRNLIESADSAMTSPNKSVNLRFGHESILLPLSVLMELNKAAYETKDLSTLADNWRNYEIFPMGSNIQMVFYRPSNGEYTVDDVLVKVLLNEAEAKLPVEPVSGPYYRWTDLRNYYLDKLDGRYLE